MPTTSERRGDAMRSDLRPPVRQSVLVRSDLSHTFDTFVRTIGTWWPVAPFSRGQDQVRDVTFERTAGGRVYETWADGTEVDWGTVLVWEPPERFVMTWNMTGVATEVEMSFVSLAPALTRVSVEHRGWEKLSREQLTAACALPGGYAGGAFDRGWAHILGTFAEGLDSGRLPAQAATAASDVPDGHDRRRAGDHDGARRLLDGPAGEGHRGRVRPGGRSSRKLGRRRQRGGIPRRRTCAARP